MGYSENPAMVRVDFFKPSGKWYCTEAVQWLSYDGMLVEDAFKEALKSHLDGRLTGMTAVCLHPYHTTSFPLMVRDWE